MRVHETVKTASNIYFNNELTILDDVPEFDNFHEMIFLLKKGEEIVITNYEEDGLRGWFKFGQLEQLNGKERLNLREDFPIALNEEEMKKIDLDWSMK